MRKKKGGILLKGIKLTEEDIATLREYRYEKGLSNKQIAKETGLSYETVLRYLGKQKDGLRAEYGSIVTHANNESFVQPAWFNPSTFTLKQKELERSFEGRFGFYKICELSQTVQFSMHPDTITFQEWVKFYSEVAQIQQLIMSSQEKHAL